MTREQQTADFNTRVAEIKSALTPMQEGPWTAEGDGAFVTAMLENVPWLVAALRETRAALVQITKREGPFDDEPLVHAHNVVENMASLAENALANLATPSGETREGTDGA